MWDNKPERVLSHRWTKCPLTNCFLTHFRMVACPGGMAARAQQKLQRTPPPAERRKLPSPLPHSCSRLPV